MLTRLGIRPRLPKSERVPIVAQMTEAGMPTRAIGAALGMTNATASRDAAATVTNVTVGPREVIGQDGKTRTYVGPGARERLITLCRQIDSLSAHLMSDDRRAALDEMPFTIMHRMERPITAERIAECRRVLDTIEGKLQ